MDYQVRLNLCTLMQAKLQAVAKVEETYSRQLITLNFKINIENNILL